MSSRLSPQNQISRKWFLQGSQTEENHAFAVWKMETFLVVHVLEKVLFG